MTLAMSRDAALGVVRESLHAIAPEFDPDTLEPDENLREAAELDSMDFLSLVELLSQRTGRRIDEEDYDQLSTLDSTLDFLTTPS